MAEDEPRALRGWDRNLQNARQRPGFYRAVAAFCAVGVVVNLAVVVSNAVGGHWGRVASSAVVLTVVTVLFRFYFALVRQTPRPPFAGLFSRRT